MLTSINSQNNMTRYDSVASGASLVIRELVRFAPVNETTTSATILRRSVVMQNPNPEMQTGVTVLMVAVVIVAAICEARRRTMTGKEEPRSDRKAYL